MNIRIDIPNIQGFALNQFMQVIKPSHVYFWSTYSGAELDLFFFHQGRRYGVEFKLNEAPKVTKSMYIALGNLNLEQLWIICPCQKHYPVDKKISVWPIHMLPDLAAELKPLV